VRPARLREQHVVTEPREKLRELVGVPRLVEEVGAEDEIPRRRAEERLRLAPADACDAQRGVVSVRVPAQELDRVLGPVGREHVGAAERRGKGRQAEPAAQLEDATTTQREPGDVTREVEPARPQLRPVGEELLLVERRLVDELFRARRPQKRQAEVRRKLDVLFDEVQDSDRAANRSTGTPSGSLSCA